MSTSQVVHHTDYRSKAEDRRKELEKLQAKGLAKTQAAQLRDAPIPKEACNFLEKQRQLFQERRKNQADAIEFLHKFRADDDFVLRSARRSVGSKYDSNSTTPNKINQYKTLEPGQIPDARAPVYSYAVYPSLNQTPQSASSTVKHDTIANESPVRKSDIHIPNINQTSISFKDAFEALERAAKEASRIPLPDDDDDDDDFGNDEHLVQTNCIEKPAMHEDDNQSSPAAEIITDESEFLILQGETDDDNAFSGPSGESDAAGDSSATPFIPFEAFSRLGESLVLESRQVIAPPNHDDTNLPLAKSDSDDESIIPGLSFMQLGASMMANDLSSSVKEIGYQKPIISPVKELETSGLEKSDCTATDVTVSQDSTCLKALTIETEQTSCDIPNEACCHDEENDTRTERLTDTNEKLDECAFESTVTPKRSNKNNCGCDDGDMDLSDRIDDHEEIEEAKEISETPATCDNDVQYIEKLEPDNLKETEKNEIILENNLDCDDSGRILKDEVDEEDENGADETISHGEEKVQEDPIAIPVTDEVADLPDATATNRNQGRDANSTTGRRKQKKSKKKGNYYVPSSSLFVSRQFFSR